MARLVSEVRPGVKIAEMCTLGDALINEGLSKVYQKDKKMDKVLFFFLYPSYNSNFFFFSFFSAVDRFPNLCLS